jgi:hypothetical protein
MADRRATDEGVQTRVDRLEPLSVPEELVGLIPVEPLACFRSTGSSTLFADMAGVPVEDALSRIEARAFLAAAAGVPVSFRPQFPGPGGFGPGLAIGAG